LSNFGTAKIELDKYPKPDVIFASPPCESWVSLSVGHVCKYTTEIGFNLHWKNKWTPFDFLPKHKATRINGVNTAHCLAEIIKHYKPQFWAIENGSTSLLFDYLKEFCDLNGYKNKCKYGCYNFDILKPTIILSNQILTLKNWTPRQRLTNVARRTKAYNNKARNLSIRFLSGYRERSRVPADLYKDIIRQFKAGYRDLFTLASEVKNARPA